MALLKNACPWAVLLVLLAAPSPAQLPELVVWYKLDELSGPTCADATGDHDGQFDGAPVLGDPGATPGTGTAVYFNGGGDKVDIPDGPGLTELRKELSAVCWMKAEAFGGVRRYFGNDGSWTWGLVNNSMRFTTRGIRDYDLSASMSTDVWHHVAVVFNTSYDCVFYLDAQRVGSVGGSAQANPPKPDWHIAYKDPGNPEWFAGHLDDIQVYSGVLTDDQVKYLYDNPGTTLADDVGQEYCIPANLNSTGQGASIRGFGSTFVGSNQLTLTASSMPTGELCYFLASQTQGFRPFPGGSQGNLCLGAKIGRLVTQAGAVTASGEYEVDVDLGALPMSRPAPAQPGDTWYFQAWFTDQNPGPTSNFTTGLEITFH